MIKGMYDSDYCSECGSRLFDEDEDFICNPCKEKMKETEELNEIVEALVEE